VPCLRCTARLRWQAPFLFWWQSAFCNAVHAVDWLFEPSVRASATYTDNVGQSADNEEDAIILTATPGFTLQSRVAAGSRATVSYDLSGVARFGARMTTISITT